MPLGRRVFAMCLWTLRTIPRTEKTGRRKREEEETPHYTTLHYTALHTHTHTHPDTQTHTHTFWQPTLLLAAILLSKKQLEKKGRKKCKEGKNGKKKSFFNDWRGGFLQNGWGWFPSLLGKQTNPEVEEHFKCDGLHLTQAKSQRSQFTTR